MNNFIISYKCTYYVIWCDRTDTLVHVKTKGNSTNEDEEITTTLEHPFYVDGKGWTGAGELKSSDLLIHIIGEKVTVENVTVEKCAEPVKVYNFEVEELKGVSCVDGGNYQSSIERKWYEI